MSSSDILSWVNSYLCVAPEELLSAHLISVATTSSSVTITYDKRMFIGRVIYRILLMVKRLSSRFFFRCHGKLLFVVKLQLN
jgi:hypothetical protein